MTEDITKDLTDSEKLNLILAELADLREWRAKVDAFMEERSRDTRPLLDLIHKEIADTRIELREGQARLEDQLEHVKTKLDLMVVDIADVRTVQHRLGVRVSALERTGD
ncbi:MAG: hypothetical protein ACREEM_04580 [Blastocatellia bacterium]